MPQLKLVPDPADAQRSDAALVDCIRAGDARDPDSRAAAAVLRALPVDERIAFSLRHLEGMPLADVAAAFAKADRRGGVR